jgi:hypothetical protein
MGSVLPLHFARSYEAKIHFTDERRRLKSMAISLASHVVLGHAMKFVVNDGCELLQSELVSSSPSEQELSDFR